MSDLAAPVADLLSIARSMLNGTMDITTAAAGIHAVAEALDAPPEAAAETPPAPPETGSETSLETPAE